jgi:hypothetical protein
MSQNTSNKTPNKISNPPQQGSDDHCHHEPDDGARDTLGYPVCTAPHRG